MKRDSDKIVVNKILNVVTKKNLSLKDTIKLFRLVGKYCNL